MKNRVAIVVGALVMFVSGYILGYTTAIPDFLRTSVAEMPEGELPDMDEMVIEGNDQFAIGTLPGINTDQAVSQEIQELKRMIVPMLTDEEIKKIREDAAAAVEDSVKPESGVMDEPVKDSQNVDPEGSSAEP